MTWRNGSPRRSRRAMWPRPFNAACRRALARGRSLRRGTRGFRASGQGRRESGRQLSALARALAPPGPSRRGVSDVSLTLHQRMPQTSGRRHVKNSPSAADSLQARDSRRARDATACARARRPRPVGCGSRSTTSTESRFGRLRDRCRAGEFSTRELPDRVRELRKRYLLLSIPVHLWTD